MQFFQNPQVFFREEGGVGLSQVEGGRLHEGADVGAGNMHQLRQIKDRAEAAGQVFREVAVLRRRWALYGAVGRIFFQSLFQRIFLFGPERVKHFQQGGQADAQRFSHGKAFFIAVFYEGNDAVSHGGAEEIEIFFVLYTGHVEERGGDMDDRVCRRKGSGRERSGFHYPRGKKMKEGADGFIITGSGVSDFFLDSFDEDFRSVLLLRGTWGGWC